MGRKQDWLGHQMLIKKFNKWSTYQTRLVVGCKQLIYNPAAWRDGRLSTLVESSIEFTTDGLVWNATTHNTIAMMIGFVFWKAIIATKDDDRCVRLKLCVVYLVTLLMTKRHHSFASTICYFMLISSTLPSGLITRISGIIFSFPTKCVHCTFTINTRQNKIVLFTNI